MRCIGWIFDDPRFIDLRAEVNVRAARKGLKYATFDKHACQNQFFSVSLRRKP
jgi:hypothetical protein